MVSVCSLEMRKNKGETYFFAFATSPAAFNFLSESMVMKNRLIQVILMVPFLVLYPDTLEVSSVLISSQMVVKANRLNEAHQNSLSERITAAEDYLASLLW